MKMKRISALLMTVVLVVAMSIPAFAALGGFIASPTGVPAPVITETQPVTPDCTGKLVLTSWADRHLLDDATRAKLEQAYNDIIAMYTDANSSLYAILKAYADSKGIAVTDLAIGSLFDISVYNCTHHEPHEGFIITLKPEVAENIEGVVHYGENGWEFLATTADDANKTITFTVSELSPFAIVYNTNPDAPTTGDSSNAWIYITLMVASVAALGTIAYNLKKREN